MTLLCTSLCFDTLYFELLVDATWSRTKPALLRHPCRGQSVSLYHTRVARGPLTPNLSAITLCIIVRELDRYLQHEECSSERTTTLAERHRPPEMGSREIASGGRK